MSIFKNKPFIIAEAGVNHNGSFKSAKKLIQVAKKTGADCIKFQNFQADKLVVKNAPKPNYQNINVGKKISQYDMLKSLELKQKKYYDLYKECKQQKILFSSTPYNKEDVIFLDKLKIKFFKLASIHFFEPEFIEFVIKFNKYIILSTGMAGTKDIDIIKKLFRKKNFNKYFILQCTSDYPSSDLESNINVLDQYKEIFNDRIGFSDHTTNNLSAILALAKGAKIFEKHFTLDKNLPGPDHSSSYNPKEFKEYVSTLRHCFKILGSNKKKITKKEKLNYKFMRRSLVAIKDIRKGQKINFSNLTYKRPLMNNIEPSSLYLLKHDAIALKNIKANDFIKNKFIKK